MKCEEVVEWMHRYLDHDLGEAETAQMLQHVAQCAECAENFSLLRALSRELEDLPQVTPRFSLVDAIMPQLDAIDEAKREQSSTIQEMSPVPAAFENLQRSSERKPKQKWLNSMAGRMSMGAAAAVVLGVAIFGYQPEKIENAEVMMSTGSTQEGGNADQNPVSREINNDEPSAANSDSSSLIDDFNQPFVEDKQPKEAAPEEGGPEKVQEPEIKENQTPKQPDSGSEANKSDTKDTPSRSSSADNTKSGDQEKSQDTGTATVPPAGSDGSGTTEPENGDAQSFTSQDMPDVKVEEPTESTTTPDSETGMDAGGGNKGLAATDSGALSTTTPKEWKSPDGSYLVMLLGDQISIYSKPAADQDVLNLVEQRNVEGALKSASWSKDSTIFNYETDQDGTTVKKSFNVSTASSGTSAK
ncbi:anti-sigma factor family protein [Paenibacillus xylanivorans]|uniref:Anti-sigma-W factor RsiW n=1 Tax=Paenibacillus xylanivorans TaxID=1705561 RepID=A0A0N0C4F1_9BACL|nr:zf-HC2 domain-containing protein [Paenibacillus xylanivorans]KOY15705.1 hypothetical protein AMS66_13530 [Paenibacillus xylanivorans]